MTGLSIMNFDVSDKQKMILEQVDRACRELRPIEEKHYLAHRVNEKIVPVFKKAHLLGLPIDQKYGDGQGSDILTYTMMLERIGQEGCSVRTFFSGHISIGQLTIQEWGNDEQKQRYLPDATLGKSICCFGLTEPTAGSDPTSLKSTFVKKGKHYILNGSKAWISNATLADVSTVYARGPDGKISAFIIENKWDGVSTEREKHKLGLHSSDTGSIFMDNVMVPKENLLFQEGKGMHVAYGTLMNGRLSVAAGCVGVIEDCLKESVAYAKERIQHGKPIGKHQLIQRHIGFINRNLEAAKLLVYKAAAIKDRFNANRDNMALRDYSDILICKAKHFAANMSFEAASSAVQIFGANGYSLENRPGRHFCDCRVTSIYEGANEILEQKMALELLGKDFAAFS